MTTPPKEMAREFGYQYGAGSDSTAAEKLIENSLHAYLVGELGWSADDFEARLAVELERRIPRSLFDRLGSESGWRLRGRRLLDVGAGQGAAVHEALLRDGDAWGIEPSAGFGHVARVRVREAGFSPRRIVHAAGERLPFPDGFFDYVVSLQVLEHVSDPEQVVREIARVLKPGGRCWISCENYLAFREQHYRVAWFPLLPKAVGALYLRTRGRKPDFLRRHITYITYPRFSSIVRRSGLENVSRRRRLAKVDRPQEIERLWMRWLVGFLKRCGIPLRSLARAYLYLHSAFRVGIGAELGKIAA